MTSTARAGSFITTKEHRRFVEFADTVRRDRTIGICYGPAGVGKTLSARRYGRWDKAEPLLETWGERNPDAERVINAALAKARTVVYTPYAGTTARRIHDDLVELTVRASICIREHVDPPPQIVPGGRYNYIQLRIIDESERLTSSALELLRDEYDRGDHGLILIGMPGIEKRFSRYAQLYSRVGFAHHYRPLSAEELTFVLTRHWCKLGLALDQDDFTDAQAIAAVARITGGNFRLVKRLFTQIQRIMRINELHTLTADVVETARSTLVIGAT